jgi:glycosyltransferase involved in cell wall biosynthesis
MDTALPFVRAVSQLAETHLIVELAPEGWLAGAFDIPRMKLRSGVVAAQTVLEGHFPAEVQKYWRDLASFNFVVHNCPRSLHPNSWLTSSKALRFVRSLNPTVVHLDDVSLRLAWALYELGDVPLVLTVHDPEPHSGERHWRMDLARWLTFARVQKFVLRNRAQIETFCQRYRVPSDRVESFPLGICEVFREWTGNDTQDLSGETPTILFFGRLSPYKGLDVLYDAIPRVSATIPGVRVVVAGKAIPGYTPPPPPLLPGGSTIDVMSEYISNSRLARLFQEATVVVCPYTDATQSGVVLTAYGFRKPVVATNVGGLPEYVTNGKTGIVVSPRDPNALADALIAVLSNCLLRRRLIEGIETLANGQLSWGSIACLAMAVYNSLS